MPTHLTAALVTFVFTTILTVAGVGARSAETCVPARPTGSRWGR